MTELSEVFLTRVRDEEFVACTQATVDIQIYQCGEPSIWKFRHRGEVCGLCDLHGDPLPVRTRLIVPDGKHKGEVMSVTPRVSE